MRESRESTSPHRVRGEGVGIKVTVSVDAVDQAKRQITLKGSDGIATVYKVSEDVKRLSEVKAGDKLSVDYQVAFQAELREPTEVEKAAPLAVLEVGGKGLPTPSPKGNFGRVIRAVTTIQAIDAKTRSITLKGPMGRELTAPVESAATFETMKVGQTIVVVFAESLTLAVEPR
jgi:hypothetical protein